MIERHVEKIILGICVLILAYALSPWGFSRSLKIDVITNSRGGTSSVSAEEVDEALLKSAEDIERKGGLASSDPPAPVPPYARTLRRLQDQPLRPADRIALAEIASPTAPVEGPDSNTPTATVTLKDVVAVVPRPGKPVVHVDREFTRKEDEPVDLLAAHVAATFPWGDLSEKWD